MLPTMSARKQASANEQASHDELMPKQPQPGYLDNDELNSGVKALKAYVKKTQKTKLSCAQRINLLEAGNEDALGLGKVICEVVFKNIPSNSKTYIHNVVLPHHWRSNAEPEDCNIAIFVKHRRAETEAEKIQFSKDRDLDIENTHRYYQKLFDQQLDKSVKSKISRIITTKELATEYQTFQKLDRLSKTYDFFLADKQLMSNKFNSLPRRLGRRFWVRERKVPLMIRLDGFNLSSRFNKILSTEPFYVVGRSSTERLQVGLLSQSTDQLAQNLKAFLRRLHELYGDNVRFIKLKTNWGISLPLFADLSAICPKVVMRKKRVKPTPVIDDFDMLSGDAKISVRPDGDVQIIRPKRKRNHDDKTPEKRSLRPKKVKVT